MAEMEQTEDEKNKLHQERWKKREAINQQLMSAKGELDRSILLVDMLQQKKNSLLDVEFSHHVFPSLSSLHF